jgi:hypothetical protein
MVLAVTGCVLDPDEIGPDEGAKQREVILRMTVPGRRAGTRSIGAAQENTIVSVDVLVFRVEGDTETFDYSALGRPVADNETGGGAQMFTVPLRMAPYKQRVVLIVNARRQVNDLLGGVNIVGMEKSALLARLRFDLPDERWNAASASDFAPVPMWGESEPETIGGTTVRLSAPVGLMRTIARIDVALDTSVAGLTDRFRLKSVTLYNTNTGGLIVPSAVTREVRDGHPYAYVTAPSIPADLQPGGARRRGPVDYTDFGAPGVVDRAMRGAIYTFEAAADADATRTPCIVVGGIYEDDASPSYYRLDFLAADGTTRLDLLRNYRYAMNITGVTGRGYATPGEAFLSRAVNMTAEVLRWDEAAMGNIVFDGTNTLGVSRDAIGLWSDELNGPAEGNTVEIHTDHPAGWAVEKIVDAADSTSAVAWLSLTPASGIRDDRVEAAITASDNTGGADRSAIVWIAAGRLRYPVRVDQRSFRALQLEILDPNDNPVQELIFDGSGQPTPQQFTVRWAGSDRLTIVSDPTASMAFPTTGSGAPGSGTLTDGSRIVSYSVAPRAMTADEISADPFLVKASRFDFTVTNGQASLTRSLVMRQIRYNFRSYTAPYYPLDGQQQSFTVRSNSGWRIGERIEYSHSGIPLLADADLLKAGGNWDELIFTTNDQPGNWGTLDVVLESTDSPARFPDDTTTLVFAAEPLNLYGFASGANYNITNNSSQATGPYPGIYQMLTAPGNFGTTARSRVIVPPLTINGRNSGITLARLNTAVNTYNADVIVLAYSATFGSDVAARLYDLMANQGKRVILFCEDRGTIQTMLNRIFPADAAGIVYATINSPTGAAYRFADVEDPVLDGAFGDLRGAYWGNDYTTTIGLFNLPTDDIVVYSDGQNYTGAMNNFPTNPSTGTPFTPPDAVTAFRHKTLDFIFVSDGGFLQSVEGPSDPDTSPSAIAPGTFLPVTKPYGTTAAQRVEISNSIFLANIVAWAIGDRP